MNTRFKTICCLVITILLMGSPLIFANGQSDQSDADERVTVDILQFKVEIVSALEKAIEEYKKVAPHVTINLETVGAGGDYSQALKVKMQSSEEPDIFNVGGLQEVKEWKHKLEDFSDQPWVLQAVQGTLEAVKTDGKIVGLPYNIEGFGFAYNKRIFEAAGINAEALVTYKAIEEAVKDLDMRIKNGEFKDQFPLLEAAFEFPAKEGWVGGDQTMNCIVEAEFQSPVVTQNAEKLELIYSDAFKKLIDLQTLYSSHGDDRGKLNSVDYATQVGGGLAIERVAMIQQGNWISPEINTIDPELAKNIGLLPLPVEGYVEDSIAVGVPMYWTVNCDSDAREKDEAKKFLNWLYQSEQGKKLIVDDFLFIPPFTNYGELGPQDSLSNEVKRYADNGKTIQWVLRSYPPSWGRNIVGAQLQKYLAGETSWEEAMDVCREGWSDGRLQ